MTSLHYDLISYKKSMHTLSIKSRSLLSVSFSLAPSRTEMDIWQSKNTYDDEKRYKESEALLLYMEEKVYVLFW